METIDKIIFLDFDGVLTSVEDGTSYLCLNPEKYGPSIKCIELLKTVLKETNAKIVISSNWRRYSDDQYFAYKDQRYYSQIGKLKEFFGNAIIGTLPKDRHIRKAEALDLWLEDTDFSGKYAILDDEPEYEGFSSHPIFYKKTVKTNATTGLTETDVQKIKEILT